MCTFIEAFVLFDEVLIDYRKEYMKALNASIGQSNCLRRYPINSRLNMVSEEYSKPKYYFWSDCLKFLATVPAILMFTCLWLYYHGTHRVDYIRMYDD